MSRTTAEQRAALYTEPEDNRNRWLREDQVRILCDLLADYADLERRVAELEEWLPISEAPKTGVTLLLYSPSEGFTRGSWERTSSDDPYTEGWYDDTEGGWRVEGFFTHWQPSPPPPKAEKE